MGAMLGERGFVGKMGRLVLAAALAGGLALQLASPGVAASEPAPEPTVTEPGSASTPVIPSPEPTATEAAPESTPAPPEAVPTEVVPLPETPHPDNAAEAAEPITVSPTRLRAFEGISFEASVTISGGSAPYTASADNVPEGLSFDPATLSFSGTPTNSGSLVTISVTDSSQPQQTVETYVYIDVATYWEPSVYPAYGELPPGYAGFPDGVVGRQYEVALGYTGSDLENTTVSLLSGQLPPGLNLAPERVHSVPTSAGTYNFTLRVQDRYGFRDMTFTIIVHALGMETAGYPVPQAVLGEPYSAKIASASGGVAPYVFGYATQRHFAGGLSSSDPGPDGLYIDANGYLSGIPTLAGTFRIRVYVRDGDALTQDIFWTTVTVLETRPPAVEQPPVTQPPAAGGAAPAAVLPAGGVQPASYGELAATGLQAGTLNALLWTAGGLLAAGSLIAVAAHRRWRHGRAA
ncbi:putative Ig domain-containing protein [Paenarthrobacter sp. NPDC058040]|uniref:putative Ig domain-containing protein n=1 Tax=unclassified Paenarthrobacter TaxID=2634190 RepID=UPI0036DA8A17